jgi:hypothetical protein
MVVFIRWLHSGFNTFLTAPRGGVLNLSARIKEYFCKAQGPEKVQEPVSKMCFSTQLIDFETGSFIIGLCLS